jgi:alpha-mannosidase
MTRFKPDQYRSPYLKQAIIRNEVDFLSRTVGDHQQRAAVESCRALEVFNKLVGGAAVDVPGEPADVDLPGKTLDQRRTSAAKALGKLVTSKTGTDRRGVLVVNSESFGRRIGVDVSSLPSLPACDGGVLAVEQNDSRKWALVDVPACGVAWIVSGHGAAKPGKPLAEGNVLRNEFCELTVHAETGGIRSLYVPHERGNRLSQQLALRLPAPRPAPGDVWRDPDDQAVYSEMVAERVEVTAAGTVFGEITSRGQLRDREGKRLAGFVQRMQIWRGVRVIGLEIELDVAEAPRADPWNSYYASRFAWSDSDSELWRSVAGTTQQNSGRRIESPLFVEIRAEKARTGLLTGGLAYHKLIGERMLDSLLVVRGETCRKFRFGIGIDVPYPAAAAQELIDPAVVLPEMSIAQAQNGSAWFFHLDVRNVLATHWELSDNGQGFRVRLLETEGRAGRVHLRSFREPASARQVDFRGGTLIELPIEADRAAIDIAAYEWIEAEVCW